MTGAGHTDVSRLLGGSKHPKRQEAWRGMEAEKQPNKWQRQLPEAPAIGPGWEAGRRVAPGRGRNSGHRDGAWARLHRWGRPLGCEAACFNGDREGQGVLHTGDKALNLQPQERRRPAVEVGSLGQSEGGKEGRSGRREV